MAIPHSFGHDKPRQAQNPFVLQAMSHISRNKSSQTGRNAQLYSHEATSAGAKWRPLTDCLPQYLGLLAQSRASKIQLSQHSSRYVPATRSTTHPKLSWSDHVCTRGSSYLQINIHGQSDFLVEHMREPGELAFRTATSKYNTYSRPRGQARRRPSSHLQAGHLP